MPANQFVISQNRIDDMIEEILGDQIPGDADFGPYQCAICGESMKDTDTMYPVIPVHLPLETGEHMSNANSIERPADATGLRLRFCEHHWSALLDQAGEPASISFSDFDGEYVVPATTSKDDAFLNEEPALSRWDQDRLRIARSRAAGNLSNVIPDNEEHRDRQQVAATLLVAAVDQYNIDYGPVEKAKQRLVTRLRKMGHNTTRHYNGWLDLELQFQESSETVIGTVFVVDDSLENLLDGPLSSYQATPEKRIGGTNYLRLDRHQFLDAASDYDPDAQYIGFYWLTEAETWLWYPFPAERDTSFGSDDRQLLPVNGPTDEIPSPPIDELNPRTASPSGFEDLLEDRWVAINEERSLVDRVHDEIRRQID